MAAFKQSGGDGKAAPAKCIYMALECTALADPTGAIFQTIQVSKLHTSSEK